MPINRKHADALKSARKLDEQAPSDRQLEPTANVDHSDLRSQAEKFEAAARELDCDPDDDAFKGVLRKLAKPNVKC